ncbi:hypothetical protein PIB30_060601 [Stylosanthes scabra]|uniref:Uncharacterized protein n=1 Tax=Stylosanthes scabra TaxID=79078 RepID=A0ABU6RKK7_9FABA|nr:hypothetical protein [Stylosanthes scabra]
MGDFGFLKQKMIVLFILYRGKSKKKMKVVDGDRTWSDDGWQGRATMAGEQRATMVAKLGVWIREWMRRRLCCERYRGIYRQKKSTGNELSAEFLNPPVKGGPHSQRRRPPMVQVDAMADPEQQMTHPHTSTRRSHPSVVGAPASAATPPSAAPSAPRRPHHVSRASNSAHHARPGFAEINLLS